MKLLLKNGNIINVFTSEIVQENVLLEDGLILGVGAYTDEDADEVHDVSGKYICPGFIDGHIHIESTMLTPAELARVSLPHGTTTIVADPHEIANVCGSVGIGYLLDASENIPLTVYVMLPSCVPATKFDESGATLAAKDLEAFYTHPRVLGLGEVMNYPGVLSGDIELKKKIQSAREHGLTVNGHAPLLSGKALDKYIAAGISDDHECTSAEEAKERIRKGQWVMIRQGTAARNLKGLLPLFEKPWCDRCLLVTDDKHPADLLQNGHIDDIIRRAVSYGKNAITGIVMATIRAAECFGLKYVGAVAPGYKADLLVLDDLEKVSVCEVYKNGIRVVADGDMIPFDTPAVRQDLDKTVRNSFYMQKLSEKDFQIDKKTIEKCRVISVLPGELLTEEKIEEIYFNDKNGIDTNRDILKLAVVERHMCTGHMGLGFISGIGMKYGAIASSVSHDSHNLIIIGADEKDMAVAGNRICEMGGGNVVVKEGKIIAEIPLPLGGLMSDASALSVAKLNEAVRKSVYELGVYKEIEPFMSMAFVSLPVIPHLKMSTKGLVDVNSQKVLSLFLN